MDVDYVLLAWMMFLTIGVIAEHARTALLFRNQRQIVDALNSGYKLEMKK